MKLDRSLWPKLQVFLFIDRKLSDKPSSKMALKSRFNKLADFFSDKDFNRDNFNLFISTLKEKGHKPSHINNSIKTGKLLCKYFKINFLDDYTYFKEAHFVTNDILTPSEIETLANINLKYAKFSEFINKRQKALILLLGETGCRVGEALDLKFSDIHASPPYVIFRNTKNGDDRTVPIGEDLYNLLLELPKNCDKVFTSARKGILNTQQINFDLKRRADLIGLKKKIWCHLFRHSYITTMLENGVDALHVAHLVGHKDLRNTMRYSNSALSFYSEIIHSHPLLKQDMSWEMLTKKIKKQINQIVDTRSFNLKVEESSNKIIIRIKN